MLLSCHGGSKDVLVCMCVLFEFPDESESLVDGCCRVQKLALLFPEQPSCVVLFSFLFICSAIFARTDCGRHCRDTAAISNLCSIWTIFK